SGSAARRCPGVRRPAPCLAVNHSPAPGGNLEPDRFAFPGGTRAPALGKLVDEVEAAAALVVLAGAADPRQPQVLVEDLDPDGLLAPAQPQRELLVADHLVVEVVEAGDV